MQRRLALASLPGLLAGFGSGFGTVLGIGTAFAFAAAITHAGPAAPAAHGAPASVSPPIAIVGARLIDGTGAAPIDDAVVVIRGGRIDAAGPRTSVTIPADASIVDGAGKSVMPGIVDLHNHYGGGREGLLRQFALQLEFGVTTARSLGADPVQNMQIMAEANAGAIEAPRMYSSGAGFSHPQGLPPGAPMINRPVTVDQARDMVRAQARVGARFIKMWVDPTLDGSMALGPIPPIAREMRNAIVAETLAQGLTPVAHIFDEEDVRQLNAQGVVQFVHTVRDRDVDAAFVQWARQQGLSFTPALGKAQDSWYFAEHPERLADPMLAHAFGDERITRLRDPETQAKMLANPQSSRLREVFARMQRFIGQVQAAGVTVALGSDAGAGNVAFGWGAHHEMALLVEAGLAPLQAVTAATGNGARLLAGDNAAFGTLVAGKAADLLLLDADPTVDIANTRRIARVMQDGAWLDPATDQN